MLHDKGQSHTCHLLKHLWLGLRFWLVEIVLGCLIVFFQSSWFTAVQRSIWQPNIHTYIVSWPVDLFLVQVTLISRSALEKILIAWFHFVIASTGNIYPLHSVSLMILCTMYIATCIFHGQNFVRPMKFFQKPYSSWNMWHVTSSNPDIVGFSLHFV